MWAHNLDLMLVSVLLELMSGVQMGMWMVVTWVETMADSMVLKKVETTADSMVLEKVETMAE